MAEVACRGCGMKIEFISSAQNPEKSIPAQRVRVVYEKISGPDHPRLQVVATRELYINHFETCPKAARFSKGRSRP